MLAALDTEPQPQRTLVSSVAEALTAQERAAAHVEADVRELALRGESDACPENLLAKLLRVAEPQALVAEFMREHAGGSGSDPLYVSVAADILRAGTVRAFSDLADQGLVELDLLLLVAYQGRIKDVALASLGSTLDPNPPGRHVPRVADLDPEAIAAIVRELERATRRQLRLATVLHSQAEAMLRFRTTTGPRPAAVLRRLRTLARIPVAGSPSFGLDDLNRLAVAFDAVGEALEMAADKLLAGEAAEAVFLLAGLGVPVPAGLPGRMFLQESLAQARPLAVLGVWHRLTVCRWAASSLDAIAREIAEAGRPDPPGGSADCPSRDADR